MHTTGDFGRVSPGGSREGHETTFVFPVAFLQNNEQGCAHYRPTEYTRTYTARGLWQLSSSTASHRCQDIFSSSLTSRLLGGAQHHRAPNAARPPPLLLTYSSSNKNKNTPSRGRPNRAVPTRPPSCLLLLRVDGRPVWPVEEARVDRQRAVDRVRLFLRHQAERDEHVLVAGEDAILRLQDELRELLVEEEDANRAGGGAPPREREDELGAAKRRSLQAAFPEEEG